MQTTDHRELTLKELLDDPMVQLVMHRDAVEREKLMALLESIRHNRQLEAERLAA